MGRTTNKQRRAAQAETAREKAAAARIAQRQAAQRRKAISIIAGVVAVAVVVAVIAVIAVTHKSKPTHTASTPASPAVVQALTTVPPATYDKIGTGAASAAPQKITSAPLTNNGKPELLFVGAEFCPFCAAERWSLIAALSRFGTFSNLSQINSSEENLPTFTFYKSDYTSKYLSFVPVENENQNGKTLESLTPAQKQVYTTQYQKLTGQSGTGFPFMDFGGKFGQASAGYDQTLLSGKTHQQVAAALKDPSSPLAKAILGEANILTATICSMTNNQPSSVCSSTTISGIESKLGG